jgi:hypothetical protein
VPLQRADAERQQATGELGATFGREDAHAIVRHLDLCLGVGDLTLKEDSNILVFLEVADGTALSIDYWAAWATALHDAAIDAARIPKRWAVGRTTIELLQPLLPAILCRFQANADGRFIPDPGVEACLRAPGPNGSLTRCFGFWGRADPGVTLEFDKFEEFRQPSYLLGKSIAFRAPPVPICYLRWSSGPDASVPEGPLRDTLAMLTLDLASGNYPLECTLRATAWRADNNEGDDLPLTEMPALLGVDTSKDLSRRIDQSGRVRRVDVLRSANLVVTELPCLEINYDAIPTPVTLNGPCAFAVRYYSGDPDAGKNLKAAEVKALYSAGLPVAVVWEGNAPLQPPEAYATALRAPFVDAKGAEDAKKACWYAADTIKQPSYTPIYFAVDFMINDGDYYGVPMPPLSTIVDYFRDVQKGLHAFREEYLEKYPFAISAPIYYVGVYAGWELCRALYEAGYASHFWQICWATWDNHLRPAGAEFDRGRRPFPHLNLWQVAMDHTSTAIANNPAIMNKVSVDLNVSWGDPGSFEVP